PVRAPAVVLGVRHLLVVPDHPASEQLERSVRLEEPPLEPGPLRRPQQCGVSGSRIRCLGHREPARVEKEHLDRSIAETRVDAVVSVAVTGLWTISRIDEPAVLLSRNQSAAIVDPEIVVIPRPPAGARAKQLLVLGHRRKFAVTPRLHLELG